MSLIRLGQPCRPEPIVYGRLGGAQWSMRCIMPPIKSADPKRQLQKAEQRLLFTLAGRTLDEAEHKENCIITQGLNQALEEMEGEHTEIDSSGSDRILAAREDALWQRQQELWDRDTAHWEAQRQASAIREASLVEENAALRQQLFKLFSRLSDSNSAALTPAAESTAAQPLAMISAPAQQAVDFPPSIPSMTGQMKASSVDNGHRAEDPMPAWSAQLHAAIQAVDEVDILKSDLDFVALGKKFRERSEQQTELALENAGPSQLASQPPALPVATTGPSEVPEDTAYWTAVQSALSSGMDPAGLESLDRTSSVLLPRGAPPTLALGVDDIFWVNQLHAGLVREGFCVGEDEMDEWIFGDGTQSALLTFQACAGIQESGVADEATWQTLLGPEMLLNPPGEGIPMPSSEAQTAGSSSGDISPAATATLDAMCETVLAAPESSTYSSSSGYIEAPRAAPTKWPVVRRDDGGRDVHQLHVALHLAGFYCTEDETRWWQFGDATDAALRTFQESTGLVSTGVSDAGTWLMLLGQHATPADAYALQGNDETDEDLYEESDRMWMIGEQRWSQPIKNKSIRP